MSMQKIVLLIISLVPVALCAADEETDFARVLADTQNRPLSLQVAVVSYGPQDGDRSKRVDLVSAIHIGDQEYYSDLNKRFEKYDAVLYELIAAKNTVVARDESSPNSVLSSTQIMMKNMLDLNFQLDEIDYSARNLVHADLSPTEMSQSMDERGESLYVYFWRLFYASMNQYAKDPLGITDMRRMTSLLASDSDNAFKVMLAYELADPDAYREILGKDSDSAIIGARNQRAIDILQEQLHVGAKNIAIFYGVAHMPDMEERLIEQLDYVYLETSWIDAWNLDTQSDK